jgi:type IV pilus assembly protein PilQ
MLFFSAGLWANESNSNASDVDTSEVIYADAESSEVSQPSEDSVGVEVAAEAESSEVSSEPDENSIGVEVAFPGSEVSGNSSSQSSIETLSVDFPDEEIRTILRNIADLFELNLVVPDTLQGRSSLKLRDVTWKQIFAVVLSPVGYTYVEEANIIKVVTAESLVAEPPVTEIFMLNYARANEIAPTIVSMVDATKGGRVQIDSRSNALVITERPSQMGRIRPIIDSLDRATEQVMIETKFVEVTDRDIKNIGVNWSSLNGYEVSAGPLTHGYERDSGGGRSNEIESSVNQGDSNMNVGGSTLSGPIGNYTGTLTDNITNTPLIDAASTSTQSNNSSLSTLLGGTAESRLTSAVFNASEFKFILSALKSQNETRLVSNPTVVTLNNKEAVISIGEQFPVPNYTYNQERGTFEVSGFEYKDIGIIMKVTPQVNNDGLINLKVDPEVSSRSGTTTFGGAGGAEIPIISTRRTSTQVALKDGYTMGLGGLIESTIGNGSTKVPVLGDIPGLGRLFRSNSKDKTKRNLLVFITARTLSPDGGTYQDVFDPRAIKDMNLRRDEIPGYRSNIDPFAVDTVSIEEE